MNQKTKSVPENGETRRHHVGPWLEEQLRQDLLSGRVLVGSKLFSAAQLAAFYHVDKMTANKAVQRLASEGLVRIQRGSGTFLNVPRETGGAGILFYQTNTRIVQADSPYSGIMRDIKLHLRKSGYACTILGREPDNPAAAYGPSVGLVTASRFDLLVTVGIMQREYFEQLCWQQVPILAVDYAPGLDRVSSVSADSFNEGCDAARRLLDHGHRHLLFVPFYRRAPTQEGRYREHDSYQLESGWRYVLGRAGGNVTCHYAVAAPRTGEEFGREMAGVFAGSARPTAVFGSGDCPALLRWLTRMKLRVPKDMSVLWSSWDEIAHEGVPINRFDVDWKEMSRAAVRILQGMTTDKDGTAQRWMINARYHEGQSLRPLRGHRTEEKKPA